MMNIILLVAVLRLQNQVLKDGRGAAANTAYASSCVSGRYGFGIFNPDTFWGDVSLQNHTDYGKWHTSMVIPAQNQFSLM